MVYRVYMACTNIVPDTFDVAERARQVINPLTGGDLDHRRPMRGSATRHILNLIAELEAEGIL